MTSRRTFLQTSATAVMWETLNFRAGPVLAAFDKQLDTSELPGFDALRWYAQQSTLIVPNDLKFEVLEREAKEFGSMPYKLNMRDIYIGQTSSCFL